MKNENNSSKVTRYLPLLIILFGVMLLFLEAMTPTHIEVNWMNAFAMVWIAWMLTSIAWWLDAK